MHYTPPPRPAHARASSSAPGGSSSSPAQQQQQLLTPGPHSLAVFLRPGCREFLCQLACFAEVVLFTAAAPEYGAPLAELLDPSGRVFRGRLYADACTSHAGRRGVKDLQVGGLAGSA
jgi:TFIIF-interacting CTD phosphatase-like protein